MSHGHLRAIAGTLLHLGSVDAFILAGGPWVRASSLPQGTLLCPMEHYCHAALRCCTPQRPLVMRQQTYCRIRTCLCTATGAGSLSAGENCRHPVHLPRGADVVRIALQPQSPPNTICSLTICADKNWDPLPLPVFNVGGAGHGRSPACCWSSQLGALLEICPPFC